MVGTVLGGYRITGELSAGGMGTVYRGEHELLGRPAAIKLLRAELTNDATLVQRFFNEAKAATAIRHPAIIEVYDFGYTAEGYAYLVMELLEGSQLAARITRQERFSEVEAAQIARGIASALKAAHGKQIIHRDLKPDNIFLVPDPDGPTGERVKVLDFGIAKLNDPDVARHTQTGALIGTPLYMAPEQARAAAAIDARADLYSLGCILYELLVGRPPFVAEGLGEIIAMQMFTAPEPPRALVTDVTPEMDALVMRLLAKEPADRYQSAAELITALTALAPGLSSRRPELATGPHTAVAMRDAAQARASIAQARPVAPPDTRRSALPLVAGALTLATTIVAAAIMLARPGDPPDTTTPATVASPVDSPVDAATATAPPDAAPGERLAPTPAKPVTTPRPRPRPRPPVGSAGVRSVPRGGATTDNGSPIELDLDDTPRKQP